MCKHWEQRVALHGEDAFAPGSVSQPTEDDMNRFYYKSLATLDDAEATGEMKAMAKTFLQTPT